MPERLRVLVIAEAANPEWTSVPLVGWNQCLALSKVADLHVLTQVRNREAILRTGWREGVEFTAINSQAVGYPLWRLGKLLRGGNQKSWTTATAVQALSYYYFEHLIWKQFRGQLRNRDFDLVHRVTPLSPTVPSLIARKCRRIGVPFVWGPINGGLPWPAGFGKVRVKEREWLSYVREAYKILPGHRSCRRYASALIVASRATWQQMPGEVQSKCVYIPENGVDLDRFPTPAPRQHALPLRAAFIGRLVPYKGADMMIEAVEEFVRDGRLVVDIIGDGPERERLEEMVRARELGGKVNILGFVNHAELHERLAETDLFLFPSVREFGGGVVLEAMAMGMVPVVADYGGPGELVTPETGFRIPMGNRQEIIARMHGIVNEILGNPALLDLMAPAARRRVEDLFTWQKKAEQVCEVYRWVCGMRSTLPQFDELLNTQQ